MALVYVGVDSMERRLNRRYYWYKAEEPPAFKIGNSTFWGEDEEAGIAGAELNPNLQMDYTPMSLHKGIPPL